ncbi:hypothetical protein [Novosphingobium sp. P6W]|uniref:hypothetical protein n=1 Tax=Novosphingobium sp. P6W TaxID=1609758 RepID=UPI0006970178|nr:hypothetical protein [Novosphingobium sp. P6W]AXB79003.1 hypothetical protein TQ38_020810 [Novosphingobium sp. P6W]
MKYLAFAAALLLPADAQAAPNAYAVQPSCEASALPCYTAIQLALDAAARDTSAQWMTIHIAPGDYAEKPVVTRDRLRLIGSGVAHTRLHFGAVAHHADHQCQGCRRLWHYGGEHLRLPRQRSAERAEPRSQPAGARPAAVPC